MSTPLVLWGWNPGEGRTPIPMKLSEFQARVKDWAAKGAVHHFRSHLGLLPPVAPRCNAPWVSAILESDGTVRPCFFHRPIGKVGKDISLVEVLNGPEAIRFRVDLDISSNAVCRRCVCSLNWKG